MSTVLTATGLRLRDRLNSVDLTSSSGELCCLIGPNGSGKTSLLHALSGIGRPTGNVSIDGADPARVSPAKRQRLLSYLAASREVAWPLLARDLIKLGTDLSDAEIEPLLDQLAVRTLLDRRADQLSTGERSRVLITRALAPRSRLLLLDEPVSNLDPLWQLKLLTLVRDQAQANGQAVLLAIHDLDLAARFSNRLIVMSAGRIVADGPPQLILESPIMADVFGIRKTEKGWAPA